MKLKELRKQWLSDPDVQSAFAAQAPEFEAARTLIKTRLRVAMTHAQVASRWEPRSLWLLGWKVVRDFPACGASSAMPMLLDADPTASCFLPMANPKEG